MGTQEWSGTASALTLIWLVGDPLQYQEHVRIAVEVGTPVYERRSPFIAELCLLGEDPQKAIAKRRTMSSSRGELDLSSVAEMTLPGAMLWTRTIDGRKLHTEILEII